MHYLSYELQGDDPETDLVRGLPHLMPRRFDGAYNIVFMTAMRRHGGGPRPARASGRSAMPRTARCSPPPAKACRCPTSASRDIRSLEPGSGRDQGQRVRIERFAPRQRTAHCFFEWIYFANVASTLDDRIVYLCRAALGKELARLEGSFRSTRTPSSCPCPTPARPPPTPWLTSWAALRRGPDAQPLCRPDLHRRDRRPRRQGPAEVHAACRKFCGQTCVAGRGHHRPLHDDACAGSRNPRPWRRQGDPSPRRLPADHRPCFTGSTCRGATSCSPRKFIDLPGGGVSAAAQALMAKELEPTACGICRSRRSRVR